MQPTRIPVDVIVKASKWSDVLSRPNEVCTKIIETMLEHHTFSKIGELSVALVDDSEIQVLNKTYRNKDRPTNVLSFPDSGPAPILGDIVIALETVTHEAASANIKFGDHFTHMLVHGFLHLQGYDHENDEDAVIMEALEIKILGKMNIDNPYIINERIR